MPFPTTEKHRDFCTVDELVKGAHKLGLPHFQRGGVWGEEDVSRLLESLALGTPCGTILLWRPENLAGEFESLGVHAWPREDAEDGLPEYLVVDGQQRITALYDVLGGGQDGERRWALNMARAVLEARHRGGHEAPDDAGERAAWEAPDKLHRRPLFVRMRGLGEKPSEAARSKYDNEQKHLVPISDILSGQARPPVAYAEDALDVWEEMTEGVRCLRERKFDIFAMHESEGRHGLTDIVQLYNRINSSGIAVRSEERAFAAMVSMRPEAARWLADTYREVHPGRGDTDQRNTWLQREQERRFGFKLFIRTFVQAAAHHLDRRGADLDKLEDLSWRAALDKDDEKLEQLFGRAGHALVQVSTALREDLGCDDFRFLPSATALRPVFQLLFSYPKVDRQILAATLALLQISDVDQDGLIESIRQSDNLAEALNAFPKIPTQAELLEMLEKARSLQHRLVSILYWLLRSRGAHDLQQGGKPLAWRLHPQKQHIVPYAKLRDAYGLRSRRPGTHKVHSIGNLTFLSGELNSNLSDRVDYLDDLETHILDAHLLDGPLTSWFDESAAHEDLMASFESFSRQRRETLAAALSSWLDDLDGALERARQEKLVRPQPLMFEKTVQDIVNRDWSSEDVRDAMLRVARHGSPDRGSKALKLLWRPGKNSRVKDRVRVWPSASEICIGQDAPGARQIRDAVSEELRETGCETVHESGWKFDLSNLRHDDPGTTARALHALCDAVKKEKAQTRN